MQEEDDRGDILPADWLAVFEALRRVYIDGGFSNIAINEAVSKHKESRGSFVRTFVKGVIRDTIRLDFIIGKLADKGIKGIKTRTLILLRMGIYAIDSMNSIPNYAAVNQSVALAKKVSKGTEGFVNAILRKYIREKQSIIIPNSLSIRYSFHPTIAELIERQYGDEVENILSEMNKPSTLVVRTNTTKTTREKLIRMLEEEGIKAEAEKNSNIAVIIHGGEITGTKIYHEGYCTVQSSSSIKAIEAFSPNEKSKVLDMCSAPGGKTTAMAEIMKDRGEIIACDIYSHRLKLVEASSRRLALKSIRTELADGTVMIEDFINRFDYVLVDAPCSGLGTCSSKPEIKLRPIQEKNFELKEIQLSMLENAFKYVKEGGYVEYSTCTLNKEENEKIIDEYIKMHSFVRIVEIETILPYNNSVGFFYAILQKLPH